MSLKKYIYILFSIWLFLLPFSTRWIYSRAFLNNSYWEYGSLSLYGTEILFGFILFLFLAHAWQMQTQMLAVARAGWPERRKKVLAVSLIVLWCLIVALHSRNHEVALEQLQHVLEAVSVAVLIIAFCYYTPHLRAIFSRAFWLGGVAQAVLGLWQFFTQTIRPNIWLGITSHSAIQSGDGVAQTLTERWLRPYGSWGGPNPYGIYLAIIFVLGLSLLARADKKWRKFIFIGQMFIASAILCSFSRGAWLAIGVGTMFFAIYLWRQGTNEEKKLFAAQLASVFLLAAFFTWQFFPVLQTRLLATGRLEERSIGERSAQYADSWLLIKQYPIMGVGPRLYTASVFPDKQFSLQPAHNAFVLLFVEMGLPIFFLVMGGVVWAFVRLWRRQPGQIPLLATLVVGALTEHFLWSLYSGLAVVGVVCGLVLALDEF